MMNKKLKYKIGDVVIINNESTFGSWANEKAVITGFTNRQQKPYYIQKLGNSTDTGTMEENWCRPSTREIKVFDDE